MNRYSQLELEIEKAKRALIPMAEFNLYDTFKIFDLRDAGSINIFDLKDGFNAIGLFPTPKELDLFMKRFDHDKTGTLSYREFMKVCVPLDYH